MAVRGIENVKGSLTDVDLSDVIAGRPEDEALEALRLISGALAQCPLRLLDLSDNALGEKGVRAAAAAFSNQVGLSIMRMGVVFRVEEERSSAEVLMRQDPQSI